MTLGRPPDASQWGDATLSYSHAGRSVTPDAEKPMNGNPKAAAMLRARHQVIGIQPPQQAAALTLTLRRC